MQKIKQIASVTASRNTSEAFDARRKEHTRLDFASPFHISEGLLEKYELIEVVGKGTFGVVFKAKNRQTGLIVAIKIIEKCFSSPHKARLVFRELYLMRTITDLVGDRLVPIVKLLDAHFDEPREQLCLVMEFMELDLEAVLASAGEVDISEETVKKILYQTSCALAFLHSARVMHRDLKPGNILLDLDFNVKICDFGLARTTTQCQEDFSGLSRSTLKEILKGRREARKRPERRLTQHVCTRRYRAPEVLLLEKDYGTAADIWSLGCVLYELVACSDKYPQAMVSPNPRLFKEARYCYPLSPMPETASEAGKGEADLLPTILAVLGKQDSADFSFLLDRNVAAYVKNQNSELSRVDFTKELPNSNRTLAKIIGKTLKFNPFMRYTAQRVVACSFFDDIREPAIEKPPKHPIAVPSVDKEGSFCYLNYKSLIKDSEIAESIISEINKIRSSG